MAFPANQGGVIVTGDYENTGCGVFNGGIQNQKGFWLKINIPKEII
jgi:hypothetical protein